MKWIEAGAPVGEGTPVRLDAAAAVPASPAHSLALQMPEAGEIPEESDPAWHRGEIDQHGIMLPVGNDASMRIQAIRHVTSAPQAMRVASLVFDTTGAGRYLDERDPRVGFLMAADAGARPSGVDGVLLHGGGGLRWPEGFHTEVEADADLVAELHYRPTGRPERLQERFELELVPEGVASRPLRWFPAGVFRIVVPAGERRTIETTVSEVPVGMTVVGLSVRALEICTSLAVLAERPDGTRLTMLRIEDWDHHQRETVVFQTPRSFPAGTRIWARFDLDNRAENPRNPEDPPVDVRRGRRTGILGVFLHVASEDAADDAALAAFATEWVRRRGG